MKLIRAIIWPTEAFLKQGVASLFALVLAAIIVKVPWLYFAFSRAFAKMWDVAIALVKDLTGGDTWIGAVLNVADFATHGGFLFYLLVLGILWKKGIDYIFDHNQPYRGERIIATVLGYVTWIVLMIKFPDAYQVFRDQSKGVWNASIDLVRHSFTHDSWAMSIAAAVDSSSHGGYAIMVFAMVAVWVAFFALIRALRS